MSIILLEQDQSISNELSQVKDLDWYGHLHIKSINEFSKLDVDSETDIVILDYSLIEGAQFIFSFLDSSTNVIPLILLHEDRDTTEDFLDSNSIISVLKPFDPKTLTLLVMNTVTYPKAYLEHRGSAVIDTLKTSTQSEEKFNFRLLNLIQENIFNDQLSMHLLAEELGFSRRHLLRKCKHLFGRTCIEILNDMRMQISHKLLRSDTLDLNAVGEMLGYRSKYHFRDKYLSFRKKLEDTN